MSVACTFPDFFGPVAAPAGGAVLASVFAAVPAYSADTMEEFAKSHCVGPILAGQAAEVEGLREVSAEGLGITPDTMQGAVAKFYMGESADFYLGTFALGTDVRACGVNRLPIGESKLPPFDIESLVAGSKGPWTDVCRGPDKDGETLEIVATKAPGPVGKWVVVGVGAGDLIVFERRSPLPPCPEESE